MARRLFCNQEIVGSIPTSGINLSERRLVWYGIWFGTRNNGGSNPSAQTNLSARTSPVEEQTFNLSI